MYLIRVLLAKWGEGSDFHQNVWLRGVVHTWQAIVYSRKLPYLEFRVEGAIELDQPVLEGYLYRSQPLVGS